MSSKRKQDAERLKTQSEDIHGFAREFQNETDRSTAILGAALLDEELRQLLTQFFIDDEEQVNLLIAGDAPVATFSARTRAAYCLGLIPRTTSDVFVNIREIRNVFAHQLHGLAFSDPRFDTATDRLRKLLDQPLPLPSDLLRTNRDVFVSAVFSAHLTIWGSARSIEFAGRRCRSPQPKVLVSWSINQEAPEK